MFRTSEHTALILCIAITVLFQFLLLPYLLITRPEFYLAKLLAILGNSKF